MDVVLRDLAEKSECEIREIDEETGDVTIEMELYPSNKNSGGVELTFEDPTLI